MRTQGRRFLIAIAFLAALLAGTAPVLADEDEGGGGGEHGGYEGGEHGGYDGGEHGGYDGGEHGGYFGHEYGDHDDWWGGHGWGGYGWGGHWPRTYYGVGFSWFLPVLPRLYATYWYGGMPYYYANDAYYTWNPTYNGYTAVNPPPLARSGAPAASGGAPAPGVGAQIFMYPKNGQSEAQQSVDKRECQQWAASQAGQGASGASDYRRAMTACAQGRGYSVN